MTQTKKRRWSFSSGARGTNRVRVWERSDVPGVFLVEYTETDAITGHRRPTRLSLGRATREIAVARAKELAAKLATLDAPKTKSVTLRELFEMYDARVTGRKSASKQKHDRRAAELFVRMFGAQMNPAKLNVQHWERFVAARRTGDLRPLGGNHERRRGVRNRVIAYDLSFLQAVLNWATISGSGGLDGAPLLDRNPLKGLRLPREAVPQRPLITAEHYANLRAAAQRLGLRAELVLALAHDTGHRISAIRHLRWSDVDLDKRVVTWKAENDKSELQHTTALTEGLVALLGRARRQRLSLSDGWILPDARDEALPMSRQQARALWDRCAKAAGIPRGQRFGWHAMRRKFATDLKAMPLRDLAHAGGWKSTATILEAYQQPDIELQRRMLGGRA